MSDSERRPYKIVRHVADHLIGALSPVCHRIEVAGSLRRECATVGDIELVAIPKLHTNLLGEPTGASEVDDLLAGWPLNLHKNGQKYKQFSFEWQPGWTFKVDLFLQPDPATWGVNYLIRTGSSDFSHKMVTSQSIGGLKPNQYFVREARVMLNDGTLLDTPEEESIFALWRMEYVQPKDRL